MGSNMFLEDILSMLAKYGHIDVSFNGHKVAATSGMVIEPTWTIECRLKGYIKETSSQAYVRATNVSSKVAAEAVLEGIEDYLRSEQSKEDRQRYVSQYHQRVAEAEKHNNWRVAAHPGEMQPEVEIQEY